MSRSEYRVLKQNIGLGKKDLASMSAQFSFNALDGIRSGSARKLVVEVVERTSVHEHKLTEAEKVVLTHAVKGTDWEEVKQHVQSLNCDMPVREVIKNTNYKLNE